MAQAWASGHLMEYGVMIPEALRTASGYECLLSDLRALPDDTIVVSLDGGVGSSFPCSQPVTSRPADKRSALEEEGLDPAIAERPR
jgi:hypothetical protein